MSDASNSETLPPQELRAYIADYPWPRRIQARAYARALFGPRPSPELTKFVIFASGRSGSSLLTDLCNCLPNLHCDQEILAQPVLKPRLWVESHRRKHRASHYGFKVKIYQLSQAQGIDDAGAFLQDLVHHNWKVVYLKRSNVVRQVLSNLAAFRNAQSHYLGEEAPPREPIVVNPAVVLQGVRNRSGIHVDEAMALEGVDHVAINYEADLEDSAAQQWTLDRLAAYLGLPTAVATTARRRINVGTMQELVENYDELASALAGTPWELTPRS